MKSKTILYSLIKSSIIFFFKNRSFKTIFFNFIWIRLRIIYFFNNWIYTTNHKRISVNYIWFVMLAGIFGMVLATIVRLEFSYPGVGIFAGDSLQYLSMASAHAVIMVFMMIIPLLFGAFGNYLLPTHLGVHDVAFPRLNSAAFWFLPSSLIMLCQLVCVDRRYQRMNCFNIREIQSLLKKKFFTDLIHMNDYHDLFDQTIVGLRYKTWDTSLIYHNNYIYSNYGLTMTSKIRKTNFYNIENFSTNYNFFYKQVNYKKLSKYCDFIISPSLYQINFFKWIKSKIFFSPKTRLKIFNFYSNFTYTNYLMLYKNVYDQITLILITLFEIYHLIWLPTFVIFLLNNIYLFILCLLTCRDYFKNRFGETRYLFVNYLDTNAPVTTNYLLPNHDFDAAAQKKFFYDNFNRILSLSSILTNLYCIYINFFSYIKFKLRLFKRLFWKSSQWLTYITFPKKRFSSLNFFSKNNNIKKTFHESNINLENSIFFSSNFFFEQNMSFFSKFFFQENLNNNRFNKYDNVIFKYDYKSGNYFPPITLDLYPNLITSMMDITSSARKAEWIYSFKFTELLEKHYSILTNISGNLKLEFLKNKIMNISGIESFFYFFLFNQKDQEFFLKRWISYNNLNQKFVRMYTTTSLQQRIYSNWRQLKFTREAWRCRLLTARHQKTLYRRYVNDDGVFWSIERNARDLIPGWAMITPFSSRTRFTAIGRTDIGLMGVLFAITASIIANANFLVTCRYLATLNNRKLRDARTFFTESIMVASWMMVAANPMLVIGILMLLSDRHWQTSFFDYSGGGDTVLFQHMFWFFGHPEVYIIIVPSFGYINMSLSYFLRKRISARASLIYSLYTIAFLGFFVWGHHMYMVGLAHTTRMLFSTLTVMISVPAATKLMHWCVTIVNSSITIEIPFLCTLVFVFLFVTGGISGMCVAHTGMDILFHDTFYVIGHFHVLLAGAAMFSSFGAIYFYFPSLFGVKYSRLFAYLHFSYYLIGQLMTVIPMFWLGYAGMPRRVLDYPSSLGGWHSVATGGHLLSVAGIISFFIMIFDSLRQARAATRTTFGITRFNTRINFYLYEISRLTYIKRKSFYLNRYNPQSSFKLKLNNYNYQNFEYLETTIYSYIFTK